MIEYLDEVMKTLVLILPKISAYIKIFKNKDGNKNNKLMFFHIENEKKLFEKYKTTSTKIEDFKNI